MTTVPPLLQGREANRLTPRSRGRCRRQAVDHIVRIQGSRFFSSSGTDTCNNRIEEPLDCSQAYVLGAFAMSANSQSSPRPWLAWMRGQAEVGQRQAESNSPVEGSEPPLRGAASECSEAFPRAATKRSHVQRESVNLGSSSERFFCIRRSASAPSITLRKTRLSRSKVYPSIRSPSDHEVGMVKFVAVSLALRTPRPMPSSKTGDKNPAASLQDDSAASGLAATGAVNISLQDHRQLDAQGA